MWECVGGGGLECDGGEGKRDGREGSVNTDSSVYTLICFSPWLYRYGYFSGINRKVQFKLVKNKTSGEFMPLTPPSYCV